MSEPARIFPLPPRRDKAPKRRRRIVRRAASLAARGAKAMTDSPAKLIERVNRDLYKRNAELAIRNKTLALLRKLDEISLATADLEDMAEKITAALAADLGYEMVSIAIVNQSASEVRWLSFASAVEWLATDLRAVSLDEAQIPLSNKLMSVRAIKEEKIFHADNPQEVFPPSIARVIKSAASPQGQPLLLHTMLYPLRFGQQVLGLLTLGSARPPSKISRYEKESIAGIVALVALALFKADIYDNLQKTSAELAIANRQLKELDDAKSEFLSIASHQLYTPLTAIRGYLSMLKEGDFGTLSDKQGPVIDIINKSAQRLIELIKNLLDVSRIESGRLDLNLETVDLAGMAKEIAQNLLPNTMGKKLKLIFHPPRAPLPPVIADRERLSQVVLNFVDNAIKYTDRGRIDVEVIPDGQEIELRVTDTGIGLDSQEIEKLFTKFTRAGDASHYHTEGSGLGLYVARQIIKEHRGTVAAASPGKGRGSTFNMRMPIAGSPKSLKLGDRASVIIKTAPSPPNK